MNMPERDNGDFPQYDRAREVAELFREAERAIKMAEKADSEAPLPAIKELRYAVRHLTEWLSRNDEEEFHKAVKHCRRAIYDANDAQLLYYLEKIEKFKNDYSKIVFAEVMPEYGKIHWEVIEARDKINRMRDSDMEKAEFYRQFAKYVEPIARNCRFLDSHREELDKKIKKEKLQMVVCWATVGGVALAFLSFVLYQVAPLLSHFPPKSSN